MPKEKKKKKVYMGVFLEPELKDELKKVAKSERRSLNAQVELFLTWGVEHLEPKAAA